MGSRAVATMFGGMMLLASISVSQVERPRSLNDERPVVITGDMRLDLIYCLSDIGIPDSVPRPLSEYEAHKKSPLLAGSAVPVRPRGGRVL